MPRIVPESITDFVTYRGEIVEFALTSLYKGIAKKDKRQQGRQWRRLIRETMGAVGEERERQVVRADRENEEGTGD